MRKKFLMNVLKSTQKISVSGFLLLYTFTPSALAISDISAYADDSSVEIDESENIANEGVSDPAQIAKGVDIVNNKEDEDGNDIAVVESKTKNETENILTSSAPRAPTVAELKSTSVLLSDTGQYTISSTSGTWSSVVCTGSNCNLSGVGTNEIKWGSPATWGGDKSGLLFTSQSESQSFNAGQTFLIGTLTHQNWPVTGDTAKNATLNVSLDFSNPELVTNPQFSYQFNIKETSNGYSSYKNCPGFPSEQNSTTPCDDVITFPNAYGENSFTIGDIKYTLKIDGFQSAYPSGTVVQKFITEERKDNSAYLVGHLSTTLVERPAISIIKKVQGNDANTAPGIYVGKGDSVNFEYIIQNIGNIKLTGINVTDDKGVTVTCPNTELGVGASMTCTGSSSAVLGQYTNIGSVTTAQGVSASDSANYYGVEKIKICHATGSSSNPYNSANASMTGDVQGHDGHNGGVWYPGIVESWGDIIPEFKLPSGGTYTGKNWNEYGKAIWNNNCTIPNGKIVVKKEFSPNIDDTTSFSITGTGTASVSGAPTFLSGNMGTISKTSSYTFNVFPGTYSFNETLPDGWSLVGNACTNITIGNGDSKDCTITNAKNGSLTIVKKALPASTDSFSFALMSGSTTINSFNLADNSDTTDASETFSLLPGNYSVSEGNYSNWGKTTSSCTNGNSVSSITLNSGDSVTCTFTNTKYGSISGYKINDADGNSGTTTDQSYVSGWNIELWDSSAERNKLNETVTSTDGKYTFTNILPGTYRVKEVLKAGWAVLTVSEQEVVVSAGENKTDVNFINYKEGSIKVVKNVDGNGDGDLNDDVDIIGATDWKWKLGSVEYSTGKTISNLRPGEYAISEVGKDNYHFVSLSCTGGADITISANEAKVNLKSGEEVTCTYTNARNLGKLIIVKKVINDNGGTRTAKEFSFKIDSEDAQYFNEDNQNELLSRMEFTRYSGLHHSITEVEANQYGYATTYNNCTNVTIPYNGEVTCEIVNDDVAPMLTVVTKVINDNGGNAVVSDFDVALNGGELTFGDGVTDTSTSTTVYTSTPAVKSNTEYSLSESDISGYTEGAWSCVDDTDSSVVVSEMPFILNEGQHVTCTVVNDDVAPKLKLQKVVSNREDLPDDLKKNANSWTVKAEGTDRTVISGSSSVESGSNLKAQEYTLSEEGDMTGYSSNGWSCTGGGTLYGENNNKIMLSVGQEVACTITNTSTYGKVTIKKVTDPNSDSTTSFDFTGNIWSGAKSLKNGETIVTYVIPGNYNVEESSINGWVLSGISCNDTDSGTDSTNSRKVSINVSNGEDVLCTFTNTKLGKIHGYKYEDKDGDGTRDDDESGIEDWSIMIKDLSDSSSSYITAYTKSSPLGLYEFTNLIPGHTYSIGEIEVLGWTQTSPTPGNITISAGSDTEVNFGNFHWVNITVTKDIVSPDSEKVVDGTSNDFKIYLKKDNSVISSSSINENKSATFNVHEPGLYTISEAEDSDYDQLGCAITIPSGSIEAKNFQVYSGESYSVVCTNKQKKGKAIIKKEVIYKGSKDVVSDQEFPIVFKDSQGATIQSGIISDGSNGKVSMTIENLNPGNYSFSEGQVEGYTQKGCYREEGESMTTDKISIKSNESVTYICENEVLTPYLKIEKGNNTNGETKMPGDDVSYTITISAPNDEYDSDKYIVNNVSVFDILPAGFKYVKGSGSVESSISGKILLNEPEYSEIDYAEWTLGKIEEGETITLKYAALISEDQEAGTYPDMAWAKGLSVLSDVVMGNVSLGEKTPFVSSEVAVGSVEGIEEGEVLGASTTIYLPDTGAKTYIILVSLISIILGLFMILPKSKKFAKTFSKVICVIIFSTILVIPISVFASNEYIDVKIEKPKSPTNANQFSIAFVAMTSDTSPIKVQCFKEEESVPFQEVEGKSGMCVAKVDKSGTYSYYVLAKTDSGMEKKSESVEVVVNLEKPKSVVDYSKIGNILKFKTADDGVTSKIQIFRSEQSSFVADSDTLIHTMDVTPNTEYTWTDSSSESDKVYYYAIRAVDSTGNVSEIVSDEKVITVPAKAGTVKTTQQVQTAVTVVESQENGSIAGASDTKVNSETGTTADTDEGVVKGDATEESQTNEQEDNEDSKEEQSVNEDKSDSNVVKNWYLWVGGLLILGSIGFWYAKKHKQVQ